jgi:hypothetical protein
VGNNQRAKAAMVKLEVLFFAGRINHRNGPGGMKKSNCLSLRENVPIHRVATRVLSGRHPCVPIIGSTRQEVSAGATNCGVPPRRLI